MGGMGTGGGVEEDAAVVWQWRREGELAYHNAPVAVVIAIAVAVVVGNNNIGVPKDEDQHKKMLDAILSIATGRPRPGHTVVGAREYPMGLEGGWRLSGSTTD